MQLHVSEGRGQGVEGLQGRSQTVPESLEDTFNSAVYSLHIDNGKGITDSLIQRSQ